MRGHARLVLVVVGSFALAACDDSTEPDSAAVTPDTVAASSSTTVAPAARAPEQVARDFLDAYEDGDVERALSYLTEDALANGEGHQGNWGSSEGFRMDVAMSKAQHIEQMLTGCEEQGDSAAGTSVRCTFDMHAYSSDDVGRGPFGDNYWDVVVNDGKITSALATWAYLTNGLSAEMWQPFQAWVASTHPEDVQVMYPVGDPVPTAESMRLWDERLTEWAATVNSGS
jgi:hypothetical protein